MAAGASWVLARTFILHSSGLRLLFTLSLHLFLSMTESVKIMTRIVDSFAFPFRGTFPGHTVRCTHFTVSAHS